MRKTVFFSVIAFCMVVSSCSKQIYSHEQVMQSYKTEGDVLRQFGQPDEIMPSVGVAQWLYNCDSTSTFFSTRTKVKVNGEYNSHDGVVRSPLSVQQFSNYKSFVKFTFDDEGRVLNWNSSGVNFAQRKAKTFATIAIVVGSVAVATVILGSIVIHDAFSDFTLNLPLQ